MTRNEKIESLKNVIIKLYCNEGRSKVYISKLLEVNRELLTQYINNVWKLEQANSTHITPSKEKWINKHRNLIKSRLDQNVILTEIAKEVKIPYRTFVDGYIKKDKQLSNAYTEYHNRKRNQHIQIVEKAKESSSFEYDPIDLPKEQWKEILGYDGYYISTEGRVKSYVERYNAYKLLTPLPNQRNGRYYVWIKGRGLQISRLVGFAFVKGHTTECNTIDHKDGDVSNNKASNLRWVSQSENNTLAYKNGRSANIARSKNGKFKQIIVDDKYTFKTIRAFAKFYNVSESQAQRYISGETSFSHKILFVY